MSGKPTSGESHVDTYLIRSLKRIHDQAAQSLEEDLASTESVAERFNEVLSDFQEKYPDESRLKDIEQADGVRASIRRPHTVEAAKEDLRYIKLQTERIADLFELDVGDFEEVDETGEIRPIVIQQKTDVSQHTEVTQTVEYTQLIDQVDDAMIGEEDAEVLKDIIHEFQKEIESEETEESRLRDLVSQTKDIGMGVGTQVGAKLTMAGLEAGYNLIP